MAEHDPKVTIDGTEYLLSSLNDEAKAQITNLRFVENEIAQLKAKLAIANTAKLAYQSALKNAMPVEKH